jgi:hypothetical protein
MTEQPDRPDGITAEVTPAEADSAFASAANGAIDPTQETEVDPSVEPAPDVAEEYAESIPIDPTPEQVEHYLDLAGDTDGTQHDTSGA